MDDITKYPYYSYNHIIDALFEPIRSQADVQFLCFIRKFAGHRRFMICHNAEWANSYYSQQFYLYGLLERKGLEIEPGFYMWDHLGCDPNGIYDYTRRIFSFAHGLTVILKYQDYVDTFIFISTPGNDQINNFYLNQKSSITTYIDDFYQTFDSTFDFLSNNTIQLPHMKVFHTNMNPLSPRQQDCAILMAKGFTSKEIARQLNISPRTVEEYINKLKTKFNAKNRVQLSGMLRRFI